MKINIQNIEKDLIELDDQETIKFEDEDFSSSYSNPFNIHVIVDKFGKDYRVDINLKSTADYVCDRCLNTFSQPLELSHRQLYHIGGGEVR